MLRLTRRTLSQRRYLFSAFNRSSGGRAPEDILNSNGQVDERGLESYLRQLAHNSPKDALNTIEKGWVSGKIPINETILKEYFKSAAAMRKLDQIDISGILTLMNKQGLESTAAGSPAISALLSNGGSRFTSGSSPKDPLYISQLEPSFRSQLWSLVKSAVGLFLLLSFAGSLIDDKGGGIASRMGSGNIVHQAEKSDKSFDDVVGVDEAKQELIEIVQYLRNPRKFTRLGGKLPKGVLLTGPPGTGKTLLARAIAGEANVPFFYTSGSEFEEMYVGVGAKRVRDLFAAAKAKSPCIIFIDEIDAIGGSRSLKEQSAMKMTLNQLLVEMDGFEQNTGIIVIAATNFPESLDTALIRPGRLDKHVNVPLPDIGGRTAILRLHTSKLPLAKDVSIDQLARGTPGFSGAELYNLVNEAALKASSDGLREISMHALEYAKDKIMMGSERRSAVITPSTARMTAFHEAGHALTALLTEGADPIHKATIMPRGRALGMVMQLPDGDQTSMSRKQMLARLVVCMGGRVAEEIVFGDDNVTSGASNDIQQATKLAKAMVMNYGLSEKLGVMHVSEKEKHSDEVQRVIDEEIQSLLTESYQKAKNIIETHRKDLDAIANALIEYESLSGSEIIDVINGKKINATLRSQKPSREVQPIELKAQPTRNSRLPPIKENSTEKS